MNHTNLRRIWIAAGIISTVALAISPSTRGQGSGAQAFTGATLVDGRPHACRMRCWASAMDAWSAPADLAWYRFRRKHVHVSDVRPTFAARDAHGTAALDRSRIYLSGEVVTGRTPEQAWRMVASVAEGKPEHLHFQRPDGTLRLPGERLYKARWIG